MKAGFYWFCVLLVVSARPAPLAASTGDGEDLEEEKRPTSIIPELDLPLPEWDPAEFERIENGEQQANLGGGLWPSEQIPFFPNVFEEEDPGNLVEEADQTPGKLLSYALFNRYFAERPSSFLNDPQELLAKPFRDNIERFLTYHSSESKITTYVLVFQKSQEFPIELSTRAIWRRWFPEGQGAIVFYYAGQPRATAIEFGPAFSDAAGNDRLQALLATCTADATEPQFPGGQLERFCVKYSVEIYRLEQAIADEMSAAPDLSPQEVAGDPDALTKTWSAFAIGGGGLFGLAVWWVRSRRPLYFPEVEDLPARLGGDHTGGTDAVMSFGRVG